MFEVAELGFSNMSPVELDLAIDEILEFHDQWLENRELLDFVDVFGKKLNVIIEDDPEKSTKFAGTPGKKSEYPYGMTQPGCIVIDKSDGHENRRPMNLSNFNLKNV